MMPTIAERKQVELALKLDALDGEFKEWLAESAAGAPFEKHNSQVLAITGHLQGLRNGIAGLGGGTSEAVLRGARNVQSLILGVRRVWEYFRSKLVQRKEPAFQDYLRAADELAWSCYEPVLRLRCPDPLSGCRREPPLVFLNGGLSPFALARDRSFQAEEVAGEALPEDRRLLKALKQLPISVIGVPWYQVGHLPDALVIAHEAGHTVESDFGLKAEIEAAVGSAVAAGHRAAWSAWQGESFADLYGCLTAGPAYVSALVDFLAVDPAIVKNESRVDPNWGAYPTTQLRILLCLEALRLIDFAAEATAIAAEWDATYPKEHLMAEYNADLPAVAKAVLTTELAALGGVSLAKTPSLPFTRAEWAEAQTAADFLRDGSEPVEAQSARALFAAARVHYDRRPGGFGPAARLVLDRFEHLVRPGTRALDGDEMTVQRREELGVRSRARGADAFGEFLDIFGEE
jgi:hypothetical protein